MNDEINTYTGSPPCPEDWAEAHAGEAWALTFAVSLDDLLNFGGVDGLNDYLDEVTGIVLSDISYEPVGYQADGTILIQAVGTVELY